MSHQTAARCDIGGSGNELITTSKYVFGVDGVHKVKITGPNMTLHIHSADRSDVKIEASRHVWKGRPLSQRMVDECRIESDKTAGVLHIEDRVPEELRGSGRDIPNMYVVADVELPRSTNLSIETQGDLTLDGDLGDVMVKLASGRIQIGGTLANLSVANGSGDCTLSGSTHDIGISTGTGYIQMDGVACHGDRLALSTGSGDLRCRLACAPRLKLEAATKSGRVSISLPDGERWQQSSESLQGLMSVREGSIDNVTHTTYKVTNDASSVVALE